MEQTRIFIFPDRVCSRTNMELVAKNHPSGYSIPVFHPRAIPLSPTVYRIRTASHVNGNTISRPLTFDVSVQAGFSAVRVEVTGRVGLSVVRRLRRRMIVAHEPHATVPTPAMLGLYTHLIFIPENRQIPI